MACLILLEYMKDYFLDLACSLVDAALNLFVCKLNLYDYAYAGNVQANSSKCACLRRSQWTFSKLDHLFSLYSLYAQFKMCWTQYLIFGTWLSITMHKMLPLLWTFREKVKSQGGADSWTC